MSALALLLAAATVASPAEPPAPCFDWAVVGRLNEQTYLGPPPVQEGEITLDSIFRWDVRVREVVIGEEVPQHMELVVVAHVPFVPWAARRVVLFLRKDENGDITLADAGLLDRKIKRSAWRGKVMAVASESGLARCSADTSGGMDVH